MESPPLPSNTPPLRDKFADYSLIFAQWLTLFLPIGILLGKAPMEIVCALVGVLFLLTHAIRKNGAWLRPFWVRAALLFYAYLLLRSFFAPDPLLALDRAAIWLRYPCFAFALAYWVITDKAFCRKLLISICIACGALCLDGLLQFFTGTDILGNEKAAADRLTGPYRQPRIGYTITWLAFPVLLFCMNPHHVSKRVLALKIVFAALLCLTVIASGERSPTLLLLMGLGIAGLLVPALRKRLIWMVPLAIIGISAFLYLNPAIYQRQVVSTQQAITHFWKFPYGRIALDCRDFIRENPIFGLGVQHYRVATARGTEARAQGYSHPHNFYLEIWVETGIIGLILLLTLFGSWLWHFKRHYALWRGDYLLTGVVVTILIRLWPIIGNPGFYSNWNVIPLWLMVGWYFALMRLKAQEPA